MALAVQPDRDVTAAYRECQRLAQAHYENFPVASRLVPAAMRRHVAAIYAFARVADDLADEGDHPADLRLAQLAAWRARLHGETTPAGALRATDVHPAADAIFTALDDTVSRHALDRQLLDDLLDAFVQDVTVKRYSAWSDLLDYCRRSANPVGRLVLALSGCRDPRALAQSDAVCTALQLANFWQDFGRDWEAGRLYVPLELLAAHGAQLPDVGRLPVSAAWQSVFADVHDRTRALFAEGRPVADAVRGRLRYELRATWLGGMLVLSRTAALRRTSFAARPTLTAGDAARIALGAIWWR